MKKKILMGCSNFWSSPYQVGSHHIARAFAKMGWEVGFISHPISPYHLFNGDSESLSQRMNYYKNPFSEVEKSIYVYVPATILPPHNYLFLESKYVHENWSKFTFPNMHDILIQHNFNEVDILYIDNPIFAPLLKCINYDKSLFRVADKFSGFSNYTAAFGRLEKNVAMNVDLLMYTAKSLQSHVESLRPRNTLYFPNGVNFEHFQGSISFEPSDIFNIPHPRVVYVGAMQEWFDFDLINNLVASMPNHSFILIGPSDMAVKRLLQSNNLHILGPRDYSVLPGYLRYSDVGIIPFNVKEYKELIEYINPLKLLEYFSCGLPVVSSMWSELDVFGDHVTLSSTEDFQLNLFNALKDNDYVYERIDFARQFDWLNLCRKLLDNLKIL